MEGLNTNNMYNRNRRPQDDLPYEQRMKHIIQHYRWLLDQNDRLAAYARKLEGKIEHLENELAERKRRNRNISDKVLEKTREVKRLHAHIEWLEEQIKKQQEL